MARRVSLLSYERRIIGTALLAVLPLAAASALLVWTGEFPQVATWTIVVLIVFTLLVATLLLREVVVYPLRTLVNVVSAMREDDYSIRAREAADSTIFGDVMQELNELSAAMRHRHLAALEAAALVRAVMAEVDAAIFAFDPSFRLELVNRAGERLLDGVVQASGLPPAPDGRPEARTTPLTTPLIGKTAQELGLADVLESEEASTVERDFGGVSARWSVRVSTFRSEGETHRLLVVANISRALRQEEIRAWQRVVRVLGHELNNSLAPIKSIAGSLEEALAAPEIDQRMHADLSRGLGVINRRAEALARFMSAYSELARLPEPTLRSVDLASLVRRVAALDRRTEISVKEGPPLMLEADEDQIEQVIINVVKNAVDAGGPVSVTWRKIGDAAELSVIDEGPGLASTANLFVPFFTTKPGGSGIGLVLSRQIAEAHGGSLTLRNRADRPGCEAVLRLPLSHDV